MAYNDIYEEEIERQDLTLPPPDHEPQRQYYFIKKARGYLKALAEKMGRIPSSCTVNFGCQVITVHETRKSPYFWAFLICICLSMCRGIWGF